MATAIRHIGEKSGQTATVEGWLFNKRSSGKIQFLILRDGTGYLQAVVPRAEVEAPVWEAAERATQESSLRVVGTVREDRRAPGGFEMTASSVEVLGPSEDYPITPKEHGVDFLMNLRHLWMRSSQQHAVLRVRSEIEQGIADFFYQREFVRIDSPILTGSSVEGTSTLFETDYFGDKAYLSQSGQLYLEPAAAAFGKVYCFGPTFRAEKSKTRRHLTEFWMVEPEVAFLEFEGLCQLAEDFVVSLVGRALDRCGEELKRLERDPAKLATVQGPFPRTTYREGIARLSAKGFPVKFGDDLGADEETALAEGLDKPLIVSRLPRDHQVVLHAARSAGSRGRARSRHARARKATARSSAGRSASTTWRCSSGGSPSTSFRARPTSGTSTCAATGRSRTRGSAWASSASWRGSAESTTCARPSRIPARSSGSIRERPSFLRSASSRSAARRTSWTRRSCSGHLARAGHAIVPDAKARVVLVNTCGFIDKAKEESVQTILEQVERKQRGEIDRVVVAGCMVQKYGRELAEEIPEVDAFLGFDELESAPEAAAGSRTLPRFTDKPLATRLYDEASPRLLSRRRGYAYLKVGEGCDNPCTFCTIPQMRGCSAAGPIASLLAEARRPRGAGCRRSSS